MPKLKPQLDALRVESFEVTPPRSTPRGTVHGAEVGEPVTITQPDNDTFFDPCPPSDDTYGGTCPATYCGMACSGGCTDTQLETCPPGCG